MAKKNKKHFGEYYNHAPEANDDVFFRNEGKKIKVNVLENDTDKNGDKLTITQINGQDIKVREWNFIKDVGLVKLNKNGKLVIKPLDGIKTAEFEYTVSDGNGKTDTAKVTVNIEEPEGPKNQGPIANDDTVSGVVGQVLRFDVLDNDHDADGDKLTLTHIAGQKIRPGQSVFVDGVGSVTLQYDGQLNIKPADGVTETQFEYTVSDGKGGTDKATVKLDLENPEPENQGPNAQNDTVTGMNDQILEVNVLSNDTDPEGDALSITHVAGQSIKTGQSVFVKAVGTVTLHANGKLAIDPVDGVTDAQFDYTITDGNGNSDTATVNLDLEKPEEEVDLSIHKDYTNASASPMGEVIYGYQVAKFTISVTNHSDTVATGVVVKDTVAENFDVWKTGDSLTHSETGLRWNDSVWGWRFDGSPKHVDQTNGTVKVVESGMTPFNVQNAQVGYKYGLEEGSVTWELGRAIEPGETVTLVYYGMRNVPWAYEGRLGTKFDTQAEIINVDQTDKNLDNNTADKKVHWVSPIALDMNGDGKIGVTGETSSIEKDADAELGRTVEFDIDADGDLDTIEWFDGSGDGILVDTSKIGADGYLDGSALFGDEGGKYANGYEKLKAHDANGDGVISGAELEGLALWMDDGDAVLEDGELQSALDAGIASISTDMSIVLDKDGKKLMQSSATTTDGKTILTEDVWFAGADADEVADLQDDMFEAPVIAEAEYDMI